MILISHKFKFFCGNFQFQSCCTHQLGEDSEQNSITRISAGTFMYSIIIQSDFVVEFSQLRMCQF